MLANESTEVLLNKAFELAYFILGDRSASIYVAMSAMGKVKTALSNQGRRLYYTPTGRPDYPATRTKVNLSEVHLLQRLVYIESELFERLLEGQQRNIQQQDLIIRYIKHLIRVTTKHNSFYVTLGLCRLLYNYSTAETSDVYNLVIQDPERIRDDYYYRSRKKRLMQEVKNRFGDMLRTETGLRREERFQTQPDCQDYGALVKECLLRFTPWRSECVLPANLDPSRNIIRELFFERGDPDEEHEVELNRIHTLIHPTCLDRLISALGLADAHERLSVPLFFVPSDGPGPTDDRFNPRQLTDGELEAIKRHLKNDLKRKSFSISELSLLIDGRREANFNFEHGKRISFNVDDGAELIELRSMDVEDQTESPVALALIKHDHLGVVPMESSARIGKHHQLKLSIAPLVDDAGGNHRATLNVECNERQSQNTSAWIALSSWLNQLRAYQPGWALNPALAILLIALTVGGAWIYFATRRREDAPHIAKRVTDVPATISSTPGPAAPISSKPPTQPLVSKPVQTASDSPKLKERERLRGINAKPAAVKLLAVKRVYVDSFGDNAFGQQLREALIGQLRSVDRFELVANREHADAVFKGYVRKQHGNEQVVVLELVNGAGEVVWALSSRKSGTSLPNDPTDAARIIVNSLRREIEQLERQP